MKLPLDLDLCTQESLLEWINGLDVTLDIQELDRYPSRPLIFSDYSNDPPLITIYHYLPMENWLNLMSQRSVGYYGPWYCLHIAYRLYFYLEFNGLFEIERKWYHDLFGGLETIEARAYRFTKDFLGTLRHPSRFDSQVRLAFQPGVTPLS